jgi:hypothetical protein
MRRFELHPVKDSGASGRDMNVPPIFLPRAASEISDASEFFPAPRAEFPTSRI